MIFIASQNERYRKVILCLKNLFSECYRGYDVVLVFAMLAAFYGGGVMLSKGSEPFRMTHLLSGKFLKYFIISFTLHFLNNLDLTSEGFPMVGPVWSYSIVQTVVSVALFLPLLRQGVDQVVAATLLHHSGQQPPLQPGASGQGCGDYGPVLHQRHLRRRPASATQYPYPGGQRNHCMSGKPELRIPCGCGIN